MRHLNWDMKTGSTDPTGDVWECVALGIRNSGHYTSSGDLAVENGFCGCAESK